MAVRKAVQSILNEFNLGNFLSDREKYDTMIEMYGRHKISCPFLHKNECLIYVARPIVCRTYLSISQPIDCATSEQINKPMRADIIKTKALDLLSHSYREYSDDFNEPELQPLGYFFAEHFSQINIILSAIEEYSQKIHIDDRPVCSHPNFHDIPISAQIRHPYWPIYHFLANCLNNFDRATSS